MVRKGTELLATTVYIKSNKHGIAVQILRESWTRISLSEK